MAVVTASAVTRVKSWEEGDRSQKLNQRCIEATVILVAQGDGTDYIPASVFGLTYIREVGSCISDGDTLVVAQPSYDGTKLLLFNMADATDATRVSPAVFTDTIRVVVKGR